MVWLLPFIGRLLVGLAAMELRYKENICQWKDAVLRFRDLKSLAVSLVMIQLFNIY